MNMHRPIDETTMAVPFDDAVSPRRRWLRPLLIVVAILVVAGIAWALLGRGKKPDAAPAAAVLPTVTVVIPGQRAVADQITATGSIAARHDSVVGVNGEGGLVTAVLVDAGQTVRKGQVLARIDSSVQAQQVASMTAGVRSAKADAALAQSNLDRAAKLVDKGFISKADIDLKTATRDGMNAKVRVAEAQAGEMQARMARLDVRAPAAGLVLMRNVETGQIVGSGSNNLFRIAEDGILEMRALVAEQDMGRLKVGLPATVRPVGSSTDYHGRIWLLDPVIDAGSRQGVARIALAYAPGLRVGAFANASVAAGAATRPVLPQSAVMVDDTGSFVYVIGADGVVVKRPVKVGSVTIEGMSITSGLNGTERVVESAGAFLQPGEKVKPVVASDTGAN
ncbi:efflux RND transporter periplasmic adaptor subunit [Glacieibacterium megasporae]|uniref:efflux RND transporter periplasmic adaptor subunit n=1 Tax=Glacieibacterium megasporae TaxID=2835787 RepID=UPI001C1E32EE|nr:efflux RND transporter periplasmic adaptor subunit [Polymorphobacter megasporae]UAJ08766.1 efflux RND transporter periplasmic adaptor subunit [Polymorphobacter megasporae]